MKTIPEHLFKYFQPERIDVLTTGLIRYTPPSAFNDPFDGRPGVATYASDDEVLTIIRSLKKTKLPYSRRGHPRSRREVIRRWMSGLLEQSPRMSEASCLEFFRGMKLIIQSMNRRSIDETIGILSFSEIPDNLLMWSHYAASHSGFVLGFNTEHQYFRAPNGLNGDSRRLKRIVYRSTRPYLHVKDVDIESTFLTKSTEWAYEREWRMLQHLSEADRTFAQEPYPIHLFQFPLDAINEVIVGAMAPQEFKESLWRAMRSNKRLRNLRLKLALPQLDSYSLSLRVVSREELRHEWVW